MFDRIANHFKAELIHFGYTQSKEDYLDLLKAADISLVTSNQDFFGISVAEAAAYQAKIMAPERLAYPEYLSGNNLYQNKEEALNGIINYKDLGYSDMSKFYWTNRAQEFDKAFQVFGS